MRRNVIQVVLLLALCLAVAAGTRAADCAVCRDCASDPVFVQPDTRDEAKVVLLGILGPRVVRPENVAAVVLVEEQSCCDGETSTDSVVMLLADDGTSERLHLSGEHLEAVRAYLALRQEAGKEASQGASVATSAQPLPARAATEGGAQP